MKLQTQAPRNSHDNPDGDIKDRTPCDNDTSNLDHSSSDHSHLCKPSNSSTNDDGKLMYDPGGSILNTKDSSRRDDGDGTSTSISTNIVSCAMDTHHSDDRNRDKTIFTTSDADPLPSIDFVQSTSPVPNDITLRSKADFPAILHNSSIDTNGPPLRHTAHHLDFDHTQSIVVPTSLTTYSPPAPHFGNNATSITNAALVFNFATATIAAASLAACAFTSFTANAAFALAITTLAIVIVATVCTSRL